MAPEQLRGIVDVRCDVYSLGRTLFELANHDKSLPPESVESVARGRLNTGIPAELAKSSRKLVSLRGSAISIGQRDGRRARSISRRKKLPVIGGVSASECRAGIQKPQCVVGFDMRLRVASFVSCLPSLSWRSQNFSLRPSTNPASVIKPNEQNDSLKLLASAIESEDSGFVDVIGEALKHSVVNQSDNKANTEEITSKIDQIVEKVKTKDLSQVNLTPL